MRKKKKESISKTEAENSLHQWRQTKKSELLLKSFWCLFQLVHSFEVTTDPYISIRDDPYITDIQTLSSIFYRW